MNARSAFITRKMFSGRVYFIGAISWSSSGKGEFLNRQTKRKRLVDINDRYCKITLLILIRFVFSLVRFLKRSEIVSKALNFLLMERVGSSMLCSLRSTWGRVCDGFE